MNSLDSRKMINEHETINFRCLGTAPIMMWESARRTDTQLHQVGFWPMHCKTLRHPVVCFSWTSPNCSTHMRPNFNNWFRIQPLPRGWSAARNRVLNGVTVDRSNALFMKCLSTGRRVIHYRQISGGGESEQNHHLSWQRDKIVTYRTDSVPK